MANSFGSSHSDNRRSEDWFHGVQGNCLINWLGNFQQEIFFMLPYGFLTSSQPGGQTDSSNVHTAYKPQPGASASPGKKWARHQTHCLHLTDEEPRPQEDEAACPVLEVSGKTQGSILRRSDSRPIPLEKALTHHKSKKIFLFKVLA